MRISKNKIKIGVDYKIFHNLTRFVTPEFS